ncbi:STAS domain-containing protein [Gordonia sp. CPCC 205333]|uniref:STAS domain-containing protein n=1 Tax=Gordonia sp. CPCC 205333 TaxID=3140790 RepID=UPI003AF3A0BD
MSDLKSLLVQDAAAHRPRSCAAHIATFDGITVLSVTGVIDACSIDKFSDRLSAARAIGTERLVLDMSGVEFLGVGGLALLQDAAQALINAGGAFAVYGDRPVTRPLRRIGLTRLIPVFDWLPMAFDAVGGRAPAA